MADSAQQDGPLDRKVRLAQLELIVQGIEALPLLNAALSRAPVLAAAEAAEPPRDGEQSARFVELAACDPAATARLLSVANRASQNDIATVAQAIDEVGFHSAQAAVLCCIALRPSDGQAEKGGLNRQDFWHHCLAVALAARMLTERAALPFDPAEAFTWGLLHDLGKLGMLQTLPKSYLRVLQAVRLHGGDIADHERAIIGVDHAVFGRRLAEHWRLPHALQEAVWLHHQPPAALPAGSTAHRIALVNLADTIAREQRLGFSGNLTFVQSSDDLAKQLNIDGGAVHDVAARLAAELQRRISLLGTETAGEASLGDLARRTLEQFDRLNRRIQQQSRSLGPQAQAMEQLGALARELRPDATVSNALARIAALVARAGGGRPSRENPVVVYSICREDEQVLAACHRGEDDVPQRTFRCRRASDDRPSPPPGTAAEAVAEMLADPTEMGQWVDLATCSHRALLCAGRWVGGVLVSGPTPRDRTDAIEPLVETLALSLALVQERSRAMRLSEQLSGAWSRLAAAQESLAEASTLAAVGEMAAGAAHEINNPLAVISGRAQLMCGKARSKAQREVWELIVDQTQRISDIITELMEFASPPAPAAEAIEPHELLKEAAEAFSSSDHPQAAAAEVDIDTAENVPLLRADRRQIRAVVQELMGNAAVAAGDRARIRLAAVADKSNGSVVLSVADNGPGMDAQTIAAAFTPFFSRQPAGRRRGLGLPRAKRYVEVNGGRMWVRSEAGKGTTVYVQLPAEAPGGLGGG
ncbi:MAG TPA: HDOD domain-containing protein [Phycisphaerae bacterium]|nr:HDOD domain-containing protein [Phycisphaerae bacterium]